MKNLKNKDGGKIGKKAKLNKNKKKFGRKMKGREIWWVNDVKKWKF